WSRRMDILVRRRRRTRMSILRQDEIVSSGINRRSRSMEILLYVLLGLGFFSLACYGLWVLVSKVFLLIAGEPKPTRSGERVQECRHCGGLMRRGEDPCPSCGIDPVTALRLSDLRATLRQLQLFQRHGQLDETAFNRLSKHIEKTRAR